MQIRDPPPGLPPLMDVTPEEIVQAVKGFSAGSAGGLDNLRPQHLKDCLADLREESCKELAGALATLTSLMLRGKVPEEICPILYGANLIALKKVEGGIRPIAVGNTLRRLAGRIVSSRIQEKLGNLLRPVQVGYGSRGGAEAGVHAARAYLEEDTDSPEVFVKLDLKNAFNSIHRDELLSAALEDLPEYFRFFHQSYGKPSFLLYGDDWIPSETGVQQGDPNGPPLFCSGTRRLFSGLQSNFNICFLDDNALGDQPDTVLEDLVTVKSWRERYGLELNFSKCELFIKNASDKQRQEIIHKFREVAPEIRVVAKEELFLLGAPLTMEALPVALEERTEAVKRLTTRLEVLQSHHALYLLKNCLSVPKLMYILRTCPAWTRPDKLQVFDNLLRESLQGITNTKMDNQTWKQATLPVRMGGLDIRLTEELALPAFLASVYSVSSLVAQIVRFDADEVTKSAMNKWTAVTSAEMLPPLLRRSQREWDKTIVEKQFNDLMANFSMDRDKARILAVSQKESGAWLNALPSAVLGNLLDDGALRISVAIRLGAVICNPHTCRCGEDVDKFGQHGLKCQKSAGRHRRHWGINDIISRALSSADMPNRKEPTGMDRGPKNKRPDGVTSFPWKNGLCLVWDATCRDTLAPSYVTNSARNPGSVASGAEIDKANKYRFLEGRYIFQPVGFETMGPWGPATKKFLCEIGKRVAEKTGERRSTEFLRQRISIEIQRGNAASVLGTLSDSKGLDAVYYLLSNPGHV